MDVKTLPAYYKALIPPLLSHDALTGMPDWLSGHCDAFLRFTVPFTGKPEDGPVRIKVEHSLRVLAHVRKLAADDAGQGRVADSPKARAALLAALYHDCGRFPQFRRYQTFQDAISVDHGRLGLRVLREQRFLEKEVQEIQYLTRAAVLLHNRYRLSPRLHPDALRITNMVRDADKLDIMRVMALHLNAALPDKETVVLRVRDEPDRYSDHIVRQILDDIVPSYADLRYVNDFRLLLGSWPQELHFPATVRALVQSAYLEQILRGLPDTAEIRSVRQHIMASLHRLCDKHQGSTA